MSSDAAANADAALVEDLETRWTAALEKGELEAIDGRSLARLFTLVVRAFAEKAQAGTAPSLADGNRFVSATDGAIAATALLEAAGLEIFELAAWQSLTNVGSSRRQTPPQRDV